MKNIVINGKKTLLREIEENDLATVLRWRNSPRVHRNMFSNHIIQPGEHRRWFEGLKGDADRKFFIICDAALRTPVGIINWTIDRAKRSCEVGIYIGESAFEGKGHAGEALDLVVERLFEKGEMREVITQAFAFNRQAVRFYEKHGFRADGSLTWQYEKDGTLEDVVVLKRQPFFDAEDAEKT